MENTRRPIGVHELSKKDQEKFDSCKCVRLICPYCGMDKFGGEDSSIGRSEFGDKYMLLHCGNCGKDLNFYVGHIYFSDGYTYGSMDVANRVIKKLELDEWIDTNND